MPGGRGRAGQMGYGRTGVVYGFYGDAPANGLTWTHTDAVVRVRAGNAQGFREFTIAGGTVVVNASKDTYVYVDQDGNKQTAEVANGGIKPKPTASGIGERSEFIAKLVSDATDITAVEDLRGVAELDVVVVDTPVSFEATEVGDSYLTPGFAGRVLAVDGFVVNALAGTDAGTVTPKLKKMGAAAATMTGGDLSFALSAAVGVRDLEVPTANTHFGPHDQIILTSAKATAGGHAHVSLICERF